MAKIKLFGSGHSHKMKNTKDRKQRLRLILLPGIGDVIYTWYKLIHLVDMGYVIDVLTTDSPPQRSHQIMGCLRGMASFDYIPGLNISNYEFIPLDDPRDPPSEICFNGIPVLHINSWPEKPGDPHHMEEFMPNFPMRYDVELYTREGTAAQAEDYLEDDRFHLFLYTSNYHNNILCNNHPYPEFWARTALSTYDWINPDKRLLVHVAGASYDADLTTDTHKALKEMGVDSKLLLDQEFHKVIEILRRCGVAICYESGFAMICDRIRTPVLWFLRDQEMGRIDRYFPHSGAVDPEGLQKWIFPFFPDQDENEVVGALEDTPFPGYFPRGE